MSGWVRCGTPHIVGNYLARKEIVSVQTWTTMLNEGCLSQEPKYDVSGKKHLE